MAKSKRVASPKININIDFRHCDNDNSALSNQTFILHSMYWSAHPIPSTVRMVQSFLAFLTAYIEKWILTLPFLSVHMELLTLLLIRVWPLKSLIVHAVSPKLPNRVQRMMPISWCGEVKLEERDLVNVFAEKSCGNVAGPSNLISLLVAWT